jgi:hypothetical protein
MAFLKQIIDMFRPQSQQEWVESYLSQSVDRYDLEARQRELTKKGIYEDDQLRRSTMGNDV